MENINKDDNLNMKFDSLDFEKNKNCNTKD